MKLSPQKISQLTPYFKYTFLKSYMGDSVIQQLLRNVQYMQPQMHSVIYSQGDRINEYYFLIKGMAGLYKNPLKQQNIGNQTEQFQLVEAGKIIGQYFSSLYVLRECSAVVKDQFTQIIKIDKKLFDTTCQNFIDQYNQVDKYAKNHLCLDKKTNSFDVLTIKKYRLGSHIKLDAQIGIILKGQCKILLSNKKNNDKSPSKCDLPSIQTKPKTITKQIALIGQNQWIYTENLNQQKTTKFKYIVTSQKLTLLSLPIEKVNILPNNKILNLKKIFIDRKQRATISQRVMSIENERLASNSPRVLKKKMDEAHKVLQKLDPNISPILILQKYKLGYNAIRYQNCERLQRSSFAPQIDMMRQRTERRLKNQYYKVKDWSRYIKLPNAKC